MSKTQFFLKRSVPLQTALAAGTHLAQGLSLKYDE
jgi:hypothetical protein